MVHLDYEPPEKEHSSFHFVNTNFAATVLVPENASWFIKTFCLPRYSHYCYLKFSLWIVLEAKII